MNRLEIPEVNKISETVQKIRNGEINVVELVKSHIQLAHKVNPDINAFITILDDAINQAEALQKRIDSNEDLSHLKLLGIPFTAKDLYLVEGTKTTFGSKFMEDFVAPYTSTVLQKCLDQGAILIGKCNCDPWGFGGSGENSGFGPTKHPLDFERTPGGSSSGSGASLLAGVGFFSLGTDTGGSVRLPASFCGLVGYKPTYGRNSRFGIGAMGSSFDTPGFFTRHIEDTKLLEEIMQGRDINDSTTSSVKPDEAKNSNTKLRIGIPKEFFAEGLDPEIKSRIDDSINKLKSEGHEIKEVSIPSTKYGLGVYYILVPAEISSNRARYDGVRYGKKISDNYEENLVQARSQFFEKEVKRRIMIGTYSLSSGYADQFYKKASKVRTKIKREFDKVFEEIDVLLSPVAPSTAFKLGEKSNDPVKMYLVDIYTVTANITGIPAISVPIGNDSSGLPIGLQIMGQKFNDEVIFQLAGEIIK